MKRLGVSIVLPVLFISSFSSVFAADKVEDKGTTATSTSTTATAETTPSYTLNPTVEQTADGKEVKVMLELKDDFKSDLNGGSIFLTYNKDALTYKSVDKEKLIGTNDFIEYDKDNSVEGTVGVSFTSDGNKDTAGKILVVTFIKKDIVKEGDKLNFEIVETSGANKSELLISGSTIKVSGKVEYTVTAATTSAETTSATPVTTSAPVDSTVNAPVTTTATPTPVETVVDNTGNRPTSDADITKGTVDTVETETKTNVTAETTKTKTGAEDYLFLSLALLLVSGLVLAKNKRAL